MFDHRLDIPPAKLYQGGYRKLGGYPVNSPYAMIQDQNVNNTLKNLVGSLYDTFNKRKLSRQTMDGFMNDIVFSCENLSQEKVQNAIDIQPKIMKAIITEGGIDFCEGNLTNSDK